MSWKQAINLQLPVWQDYSSRLDRLEESKFPSTEDINRHIGRLLTTEAGKPVRFIDSDDLDAGANYEQQIYRSGQISTRKNNFHDLFNALVWKRYPRLKAMMNAAHCAEMNSGVVQQRSGRRDALTLFDECGMVVVSKNTTRLEQLAQHEWHRVFCEYAHEWGKEHAVFVIGHGLLEKYLNPYMAITAQALLIEEQALDGPPGRESMIASLDRVLAKAIKKGNLFRTTHCLSAIPLAGIPGWWKSDVLHNELIANADVFRPLGKNRPAAPVYNAEMLLVRNRVR